MLLFPLALAAGVAAGLALGGTMSLLARVRMRAAALAVVAALGQASLPFVPGAVRFPVVVLSYTLAGIWLALNVRGRPLLLHVAAGLLALGWVLNTAVIAFNGGMPVSLPALAETGGDASTAGAERTMIRKHLAGTEGRRLTALGDVIALRGIGVVSAGDLVLAAGMAVAVAAGMAPGAFRRVPPAAWCAPT